MADIRINALPNEPTPNGTDVLPIDGATTRKTTITAAVLAGRPTASQAEAEAGTDPTKAMTPLTTAQAIAFQGAAGFVPQSRTLTAGAGLTGGGDLSADRSFDVDFTAVQAFSTKLTNLDGTALSAGGMLFGAGVNTWSVLPLGTNNQVLQIIGGNPSWQNVAGTGDVVGPASSVDLTIPTYSGTTGKILLAGNPALADMLNASMWRPVVLSNNVTDAVNDINFSAGVAFSADATHWPMVASALIKRLDAAWAVGTNQGGRMSAAAIGDTTYHCYMIRRPDTGVVDFGFDVSATAPTMPANYTQYKRVGSIIRSGGAILGFQHVGNKFTLNAAFSVRSNTAALAASLLTFAVPGGIQVEPLITFAVAVNVNSTGSTSLGSASAGTVTSNVALLSSSVSVTTITPVMGGFLTNTAQQLYVSVSIPAGTLAAHTTSNIGWIDTYL